MRLAWRRGTVYGDKSASRRDLERARKMVGDMSWIVNTGKMRAIGDSMPMNDAMVWLVVK